MQGEREGSIDTGHVALDDSFNRFSSASFDSRKKGSFPGAYFLANASSSSTDFSDSLTNKQQRQKYQVLLKSNKESDKDGEQGMSLHWSGRITVLLCPQSLLCKSTKDLELK